MKFFEAPTTRYVDVYLSGDENEQLRQGFYRQLEKKQKARTAVYGDLDAVVTGPSSDECDAVDDLIDTVPTTLAGLFVFLDPLGQGSSPRPGCVRRPACGATVRNPWQGGSSAKLNTEKKPACASRAGGGTPLKRKVFSTPRLFIIVARGRAIPFKLTHHPRFHRVFGAEVLGVLG